MDISTAPLEEIVHEAWDIGRSIDLSGIGYGRIHWGNKADVLDHPFPYYFFLAGVVRLTNAKCVIEAGTHHGGSAKALAAGLFSGKGTVKTFDVNPEGAEKLDGLPNIAAHTLDINSEGAFNICEHDKPDIFYIDAMHRFWDTLLTFRLYAEGLSCRFCILDDISLNEGMSRVWRIIEERHDAINAAKIVPQIRSGGQANPGFGLVRLRHPSPLP